MTTSLLAWCRPLDALSAWAGRVAAAMVLLATAICVGNALLRYGFNLGSNAWIEAQTLCFGLLVYLGGAQTLRLNEHIRVDVFYARRSERARLWTDVFGLVAFLLPVAVTMTWLSWTFFLPSLASGEMSNNAGGLPMWPAKATLPAGFALLTLQGLAELLRRIAALRGDIALDLRYEKPQQ